MLKQKKTFFPHVFFKVRHIKFSYNQWNNLDFNLVIPHLVPGVSRFIFCGHLESILTEFGICIH